MARAWARWGQAAPQRTTSKSRRLASPCLRKRPEENLTAKHAKDTKRSPKRSPSFPHVFSGNPGGAARLILHVPNGKVWDYLNRTANLRFDRSVRGGRVCDG